jgi:hypothetical protein
MGIDMDTNTLQFAPATLYRLSLGRGRKNREEVNYAEVSEFCREVITPHFPGFAVTMGLGWWQGKPEGCFHVDILVSEDNVEAESAIRAIVAEYNTRFDQECVLVAQFPAGASFVSARQVVSLAA